MKAHSEQLDRREVDRNIPETPAGIETSNPFQYLTPSMDAVTGHG